MRLILQAGSTKDSSAQRSISSPALGASIAMGIMEYQGSHRRTCCRYIYTYNNKFRSLRVLCRCYILALLRQFLILLIYLNLVATILQFIAITLSSTAMTIKSLQYSYHIAMPLLRVAICNLPFPTTWFASQYLCSLLQQQRLVLP